MARRKSKRPAVTIKRIATGRGYYLYRDSRGRWTTREAWEVARAHTKPRARFPKERERVLKDVRPKVRKRVAIPKTVKHPKEARALVEQTHLAPLGSEFELTVRYRQRNKPSAPEMNLKLRVEVLAPMPSETARLLADRALRSGIVPPGLRVAYLDWSKKGARRGAQYAYEGEAVPDAMRAAYNVMMGPGAVRRFEPVREDAEGRG